MRNFLSTLAAPAAAVVTLLAAGCDMGPAPVTEAAPSAVVESFVVQPERTPLERQLDGKIEAVNQGTVAAQTSGRVAEVKGETDRLLVPTRALVERGEVTAVYVVDANGGTSLRQIRPGHRFDDRVEALAGLSAGERVALDPVGAMKQLATRKKAADSRS